MNLVIDIMKKEIAQRELANSINNLRRDEISYELIILKSALEQLESVLSDDENSINERCEKVLNYLIPNYKNILTITQYKNAMDALKSIAYGTPKGFEYKK